MELDVFLKAYSEEYWRDYLDYHRGRSVGYESQLGEINVPEDIALVLCSIFGEQQATQWLQTPVPILGGLQPKELLSTEQKQNILKEVIMRMPD